MSAENVCYKDVSLILLYNERLTNKHDTKNREHDYLYI